MLTYRSEVSSPRKPQFQMIQNDTELKTSQQHIVYFQELSWQLQVKVFAEEFSIISSGYWAEIEKRQEDVPEYLTHYVSEPIQETEA